MKPTPAAPALDEWAAADRRLALFGADILDVGADEALEIVEAALAGEQRTPWSLFFVNAHTLQLASEDAFYRTVLGAADCVFGDGTGVRWAVRLAHGIRLQDNVNGTDLVPELLARPRVPGRRCFLLGARPEAIEAAAREARRRFPRWEFADFHHGYVDVGDCGDLISRINHAKVDLVLVGMGNPKQEIWIHENRKQLDVRVCIGVGGLFDYWSGDLDRAPAWMRRSGIEWLHLMLRQRRKLRRYLIGGPQFLFRVARGRYAGPGSKG